MPVSVYIFMHRWGGGGELSLLIVGLLDSTQPNNLENGNFANCILPYGKNKRQTVTCVGLFAEKASMTSNE